MMEQISELFASIVAYGESQGVKNINELPGCWEAQVDPLVFVAMNGHQEDKRCSKGMEVPPFHAFIEVNGWPAALVSPAGGTIMGGSEDDLIERFKRATSEAAHDH